jgi:hypothetical protein
MLCSIFTSHGRSVCRTKSIDWCSMLLNVDLSRSPIMWGGTRKMRAISLSWNFRVSIYCASSMLMVSGVHVTPSSSTAAPPIRFPP